MKTVFAFAVMTAGFTAVIFFLVSFFPATFYVIQSGSMAPAINIGDLAFVIKKGEYFPGEVITFKGETGRLVTHRIEEREGEGVSAIYRTKGDASAASDHAEIKGREIMGKVEFVVPFVGRALVWARSSTPFFLASFTLLAVLGFIEVREVFMK